MSNYMDSLSINCVIAIDLGDETGLAIYYPDERQLILDTVDLDLVEEVISNRPHILRIVEKMPRHLEGNLFDVYRWLEKSVAPTVFIYPGEWKPIARKWRIDAAHTVHERDAWCLLRFYYLKKGINICPEK